MFNISTIIERNGRPSLTDIGKTKDALRQLGYYAEDDEGNPYPNRQIFAGLKQFQSDNGLKEDGRIKPDGETANALNMALVKPAEKPKMPPKPKKKPDLCAAQKTAYENAKKHLQQLIEDKQRIQGRIDHLERQLDIVKITMEKEGYEEDNAKVTGLIGGGLTGLTIGGIAGSIPGAAAGLAAGIKAGGKAGPIIEEVADAVTSEETNFTLRRKGSTLLKQILELRKQILDTIEPRIREARAIATRAKRLYDECKARS